MMKRKILLTLFTALAVIACAAGIAGCNGEPQHEHSYSSAWSYDEEYHWHAATCEHKDEVKDRAAHTFGGDTCTVCGYERQPAHTHTLVYNAAKAATCTEDGNVEYWHCSGCGKNFSDGDGKTEIGEVIISAKGHVWGSWLPEGEAHVRKCSQCDAQEKEAHVFENNVCNVCGAAEFVTDGLEYTLSEDGAYYIVTGLGSVTDTAIYIPSEYSGKPVLEIGESAFEDNGQITYVNIPAGLESIRARAFYSCASLTGVAIPHSVELIGDYAFYKSGLTEIALPAIAQLGKGVFQGCEALTRATFGSDCTLTELPYCTFYKCTAMEHVTLPSSVTALGDYALGYAPITQIDLSNVETIGYAAMYYTNVAALALPAVRELGESAFYKCTALVSVAFGEDCALTELADGVFSGCTALETVTLPAGLKTIGKEVFQSCYALSSVNLPEGLASIGDYAFWGCKALEKIQFPASLSRLGKQVFNLCESLEGVYISDIAAWCALEIDGSSEGNNPIRYAHKLYLDGVLVEDLAIPAGVTSINDSVFYGLESLRSVVIPEGVTYIGGNSFNACANLVSVIIPVGVETIKGYAFYDCPQLNIYYAGTQEQWKEVERYGYATGKAAVYCYSDTQPAEEGNFWHYAADKTTPVIWSKEEAE